MPAADNLPTSPGLVSDQVADLMSDPSLIGQTIGPYRLLEVIGEGGFGVVYLAERRDPFIQRVALKVIKPGMDSKAVVARFEQERQALAVMDHPNIAKVFDAGTTPPAMGSRPYFVMEHVKGEPITEFCDRLNLSIRERLELFIPVCEAVQHAHMKGVIHRDIKPSNILVSVPDTASASSTSSSLSSVPSSLSSLPKVIDFGVAKAITGTMTDKTIFTEHGVLIGTPEYMSPEQAEMGATDIDTRTDVYSLGVVLYELLTGALPFDRATLRQAALDEIRRIIREDEPPKPSTKLTSLGLGSQEAARKRHTDRDALVRELRRELEWVPLKAMRKDRRERYRTPSSLADEIRNYLDGRALLAGPESPVYRTRKFVRRNKGLFAATSAVGVALLVGVIGFAFQASRAARERDDAVAARKAEQAQRTTAETATQFLKQSLWYEDNPDASRNLSVLDAIRSAIRQLDAGTLRDQPDAEQQLRFTFLPVLSGNGLHSEALSNAQGMLDVLTAAHPGDHQYTLTCLRTIANILIDLGRNDDAVIKIEASLQMTRRLYKDDNWSAAFSFGMAGWTFQRLEQFDRALSLHRAAVDMYRRLNRDDHILIARSLYGVASCLESLGRTAEALPEYEAALEMNQRLSKGDNPDVATSLNTVAFMRQSLGRAAEAEPLFLQALEMRQRLFKGDHPEVATSLNNVANVRLTLGRAAEAEPLFLQALEMNQRLLQGDHPEVAINLSNLARTRQALGKIADARRGFDEAIAMLRRVSPQGSALLARVLWRSASARLENNEPAAALPELEESVVMAEKLLPPEHPQLKEYRETLAKCRAALAR